jgi:hypothetical protein
MMIVNFDAASEALSEALSGRICSYAWLGYGNPLFLGFGKVSQESITLSRGTFDHRVAEYKVTTNFADWSLETLGPAASMILMDMDQAEHAVKALEGKQVLRWQLIEGHGLQIEFEGRLRLRVVPWKDAESADSDSDAWCVSLPGNRVVAVSCDGRVAAVDSRVPTRDWFPRDRE